MFFKITFFYKSQSIATHTQTQGFDNPQRLQDAAVLMSDIYDFSSNMFKASVKNSFV